MQKGDSLEIGYCDRLHYIYELGSRFARAITPIPVTTAAFLQLEANNKTPINFSSVPPFESDLIFREDFYDPKTRIKRGRLYKRDSSQPHGGWNSSAVGIETLIYGEGNRYEFLKYSSIVFPPQQKLTGKYIFLAGHDFATKWKILSVDIIHTRELFYTIKAPSSLELIPELNVAEIPIERVKSIQDELDALVDDIGSEPESVVDHCRDLATAILRAKCNVETTYSKDLSKLIALLDERFPKSYMMVKNCMNIINRLHPRRKRSELESRMLRPLDYGDSELAVACVCTILKDLGWAR